MAEAPDGTSDRPLRQLLLDLQELGSEPTDDVNVRSRSRRLASNAETVMAVCYSGLGAIGSLLAHSSPVIEDGTVGADHLEAIGWLMAELGDLAGSCTRLMSEHCWHVHAPD